MDVKSLQDKLARLQPEKKAKKETVESKTYLKLKAEPTQVRILPYPHQKDSFIEVYWHYNVAGVNSIYCPKENEGLPCPICELSEKIRLLGGKENWFLSKQFAPKLRCYAPVIVRSDPTNEIKLWGFPPTLQIRLIQDCLDPDWGDITHPTKGYDLNVWSIPKGEKGNTSDYPKPDYKLKPKQCPIMVDSAKAKELIASIPNYKENRELWPLKTEEELREILAKLDKSPPEESGEHYAEETTNEETPETKKSENPVKANALSSRLEDLFEE